MKKLICLMLFVGTIIIPFSSLADGRASARNKCRNDVRYKAKAKVNGPNSCVRERFVDKNCSSAESYARLLKSGSNCTCIGSDWQPGAVLAAEAQGIANSNQVYSHSFKTNQCSGYKAGGFVSPYLNNLLPLTDAGLVDAQISLTSFDIDYSLNQVSIKDIAGKLAIVSDDFLNEYSIIQLGISIIHFDENDNETEEVIYFTQAMLKNGELQTMGDNSGFTDADFSMQPIGNGMAYAMNRLQKIIQLQKDIDEDMIIEVYVTTDAGNIITGESEIEKPIIDLTNAQDLINRIINFKVLSEKDYTGILSIRDINGNEIYKSEILTIIKNQVLNILVPYSSLDGHGNYFIAILKTTDNQIVSNSFLKP
jgi:hypothetical protein